MTETVKTRRRYDSPRRREQAAQTRADILDAAERLFLQDGFAATSMPTIAAAAGVSLKTVYLAFATKAGVLHALWDVRLGGDHEPVPVVERGWYLQLLEEDDPLSLLHALTHQSRVVKDRAGAVMLTVRQAAAVEPAIAELWQRIETEFRKVLGGAADRLTVLGALTERLDATTATDILWTLNHPDTWNLLVHGCHWSSARYEQWLYETLVAQLIDAG